MAYKDYFCNFLLQFVRATGSVAPYYSHRRSVYFGNFVKYWQRIISFLTP